MQNKLVTEIFAGINSSDGYESLLEGEISTCEKVFILKGSPGCGKSTLLKRLLANAIVRGERITAVKCSADPNSLDAVIFPEKSIAVADGTPPHVLEPTLPGVRETIINLSENIDTDILTINKNLLERLNANKKRLYKAVYSLLSAVGRISDSQEQILSKGMNDEKIAAFSARFVKKHLKPSIHSAPSLFPVVCFCADGFVWLPINTKPITYSVGDFCGCSEKILTHLCYAALSSGVRVLVVPSPVDARKPNALFFPDENILVMSERYSTPEGEKHINPFRFIDNAYLKDNRGKLKFLNKIRTELIGQIQSIMIEAREVHGEIERIYTFANDFAKADDTADMLRGIIFGE